jgi:hypothetical protein
MLFLTTIKEKVSFPFTILTLFFLSDSLFAQEGHLFDGVDTVQCYVEINGKFSRQAPWDVNLINGSVDLYRKKPEDLDIPEKTISLLNEKIRESIVEILSGAQFKRVSWKKKDYEKWRGFSEPLFSHDSDRYYRIDLVIAGDNGVGGHYGGTDIQMYFKSMHRSTNVVYGYSFRKIVIGSSDEETLTGLKRSLGEMLRESYHDWKLSLDKDLKSPRRYLLLHFETTELNQKQKKFIRNELFPCLYNRADSLGYVDMKNFYYQIFYRLKNFSEGETEEDYLTRYAELLQFSIGSSAKYPCSFWKTPMEGYRPTITIDSLNKLITMGWKKKE